MGKKIFYLSYLSLITGGLLLLGNQKNLALPPPDDIPEEVLRTEIIIEARSPIDGTPLTAVEYDQLKEELATSPYPPEINPKIRTIIFLLQIRKFLKTVIPIF